MHPAWARPVGGALLAAAALISSFACAGDDPREFGRSVRKDGSTIHWTLTPASGDGPRGLLLAAQGSGCAPASANPTLKAAHAIAPSFTLLTVEKVGVTPGDSPADPMADCTKEYFAGHTVSQRAADVQQVVAELRRRRGWSDRLVLFGGSEGGAVVARLAARVEPGAAIVYSTGLGEPLAVAVKRVIPPQAAAGVDAMLAAARQRPESAEVGGGNSYRWWADIADAVLVDELLKSRAPVLLVQGARDSFAPVESGRAARDAYRAAGRSELTYWEYADYDHFMADSAGVSHRDEVFARIAKWVEAALQRR